MGHLDPAAGTFGALIDDAYALMAPSIRNMGAFGSGGHGSVVLLSAMHTVSGKQARVRGQDRQFQTETMGLAID